MTIFKTNKQVALQDLLVAVSESVDLYRDAAEFLENELLENTAICTALNAIAHEREYFIMPLEQLIRATGDLPASPDEDKETGRKWLSHLFASLSEDSARDIVNSRLEFEQQVQDILNQCRELGLEDEFGELLMSLSVNISWTKDQLQILLEKH